jgi:peptide/nickel transport system substrate-binding protein
MHSKHRAPRPGPHRPVASRRPRRGPARRVSPLLPALVAGLGLLGSCAPAPAASGEIPGEPRYGGTAVIAWGIDYGDLSPLTTPSSYAIHIASSVHLMPLLRWGDDLEPEPYLARSWETSPDGEWLVFRLRDDVRWHDGVPTTAHDVKFSYDLYMDPRTPYGGPTVFRDYYGEGEVVDSFTFRVRVRPYADHMAVWTWLIPVPRHRLEGVAHADLPRHDVATLAPLGNGPFRFAGRVRGQEWVFEANEDFPDELGGRPYLDRLVIRAIPEPTTRLTELLTGGAHLAQLSGDQWDVLDRSAGVRPLPWRAAMTRFIAWNTRREPFDDPRVRRALTLAIDRQGIIDGLLHGRADLATSLVPPFAWQHDPSLASDLAYDPAAARRLLASAGWGDRDGDGLLEDRSGRPFRFTLTGPQDGIGGGSDVLQKVASDLRRIGVLAELRLLEQTTVNARAEQRDFDGAYGVLSPPFPIRITRDTFHCERRESRFHWSGICDAELDRQLDELPRIVERERAKPLWDAHQRRLAELQPYSFLFHPHEVAGLSERLRGVRADHRGPFVEVHRWWLAPAAGGGGVPGEGGG